MSESAITVVEISLSAPAAARRVGELTRWLLDTGVIEPNHNLIEPWLTGSEPRVTCRPCGRPALLGDWIGQGDEFGQWTFYVGELAVSFNNWPALDPAFLTELGTRMGPRWRVVSEHR